MYDMLHDGSLYDPSVPELTEIQAQRLEMLYDYNRTRPTEGAKRALLLHKMFAEIGEGCVIEPPFHANWAGQFVHLGKNVYANFGLTLVDDTHIYIGDCCLLAPRVVIATAGHPILPELRERGLQYNAPVHIGRNCWLGAGALVMPGVTIGENTVVGAGSVVTRDLPANVVAVGNPCRVLRSVGERDRQFYFRDRQIPPAFLSALEQ